MCGTIATSRLTGERRKIRKSSATPSIDTSMMNWMSLWISLRMRTPKRFAPELSSASASPNCPRSRSTSASIASSRPSCRAASKAEACVARSSTACSPSFDTKRPPWTPRLRSPALQTFQDPGEGEQRILAGDPLHDRRRGPREFGTQPRGGLAKARVAQRAREFLVRAFGIEEVSAREVELVEGLLLTFVHTAADPRHLGVIGERILELARRSRCRRQLLRAQGQDHRARQLRIGEPLCQRGNERIVARCGLGQQARDVGVECEVRGAVERGERRSEGGDRSAAARQVARVGHRMPISRGRAGPAPRPAHGRIRRGRGARAPRR